MSFTDQKPFVVTAEQAAAAWGGRKNGEWFRCYLCGHRFQVGDTVRWVAAGSHHVCNLMTCTKCDGPDVLERWVKMHAEAFSKFWWFTRREEP